MVEQASLKVRPCTRDRVNKLLSPGETVDDWVNKILPPEEDFSELDQLRKSLDEKARLNAEDWALQQLHEKIADMDRRRVHDEGDYT